MWRVRMPVTADDDVPRRGTIVTLTVRESGGLERVTSQIASHRGNRQSAPICPERYRAGPCSTVNLITR